VLFFNIIKGYDEYLRYGRGVCNGCSERLLKDCRDHFVKYDLSTPLPLFCAAFLVCQYSNRGDRMMKKFNLMQNISDANASGRGLSSAPWNNYGNSPLTSMERQNKDSQSVGGITGYSKAMLRYKVNKSIEQVSLISQNVRSFFASQRNYGGLDSPSYNSTNGLSLIKKAKLVPDEMIDENNSIVDDGGMEATHHIFNHFGGGVAVNNDGNGAPVGNCYDDENCKYFQINFFRLPQEACIELATQDWRSSAMGLIALEVYNFEATDLPSEHLACIDRPTGTIYDDYIEACPNGTTVPIPVPLDIAVDACNCPNNDCEIVWVFK